jgi:hypothetical protein
VPLSAEIKRSVGVGGVARRRPGPEAGSEIAMSMTETRRRTYGDRQVVRDFPGCERPCCNPRKEEIRDEQEKEDCNAQPPPLRSHVRTPGFHEG